MIILIVDDEQLLRSALGVAFIRNGYEVLEAGNGLEALTLFLSHHVDLVVTDLDMPEMDGLQLLAWFRERDPMVPPVIVMTGHSGYTSDDLRTRGATDVFRKPFKFKDLFAQADFLIKSGREGPDPNLKLKRVGG